MRKLRPVVFAFLLVAGTARGGVLDSSDLLQQMQFNFGNPGAKSLGMGGAFIGRADDASAAEANPAGLASITRREATLEVRNFEVNRTVNLGGVGFQNFKYDEISDQSTVPTFASVVLPTTKGVYSIYYHKPLSFQLSSTAAPIDSGQGFATRASVNRVDFQSETFGGAAAWKFGGLSAGAALRYQRVDPGSRSVFGTGPNTTTLELGDSDSALSYNAGLRWTTPSDNFSVGAVYEYGADFKVEQFTTFGSATQSQKVTFDLPDSFGAGVSFRPIPSLLVNVDAVQVRYADLLVGYQPVLATPGLPASEEYDIADVTELHAGLQYTIVTGAANIALRAGAWRDPAHGLRFTGNSTTARGGLAKAIFTGGEDVDHMTVGFGYLAPGFDINVGYDAADSGDTLAASLLFRF